jgi:hypothetical protein
VDGFCKMRFVTPLFFKIEELNGLLFAKPAAKCHFKNRSCFEKRTPLFFEKE